MTPGAKPDAPPAQDDPPAHDQAVEEPCPETQDLLGIPEPEEAPGMRRGWIETIPTVTRGKPTATILNPSWSSVSSGGRRRVQPVMRFALRARSWKRIEEVYETRQDEHRGPPKDERAWNPEPDAPERGKARRLLREMGGGRGGDEDEGDDERPEDPRPHAPSTIR